MDKPVTFPISYLAKEIGDFYKMMGDKRAWESGKIHRAKSAITVVYLNTNCVDHKEHELAGVYLMGAIGEYIRRAFLLGIDV